MTEGVACVADSEPESSSEMTVASWADAPAGPDRAVDDLKCEGVASDTGA